MGRGRAKAKQTKVARQLKYSGPQTDLAALQAELAGSSDADGYQDDDYADRGSGESRGKGAKGR